MENKSLYQLKKFRFALWSPIVLGVIVAVYINLTSDLTLLLGYEGLNNIFIIFKVPLYLASLSFPLVALIAANHRSEQTKKQIHISTLPALDFDWKHNKPELNITLKNKGLGIAKILSFQYKYNGVCQDTKGLSCIFDSIVTLDSVNRGFGYCHVDNLIAKDENMRLFSFSTIETSHGRIKIIYDKLGEFLNQLSVEIRYVSIFESDEQIAVFNFGGHIRS